MHSKKSIRTMVLIPILVLILAGAVYADSLFDPAGVTLFTDFRAANIGDILFILIEERTITTSEAKTNAKKEIEITGGTKVTGFFEDLLGFPNVIEPLEEIDIDPSEEFKALGKTSNKGVFTAQITATVIEILPNGNFVIEGKRSIAVNDDTEELTITGTIRAVDIDANNAISSRLMADVSLGYTGRGDIAARQKAGIFTQLFNFIF